MNNYDYARKIVKEKKKFYNHTGIFTAVMIFFLILNITTSPDVIWFFYPMLGWGIGLFAHYTKVFGLPFSNGIGSAEWEAKEIQKEMDKLDINNPPPPRFDDELELKEFKTLRREWDGNEFV